MSETEPESKGRPVPERPLPQVSIRRMLAITAGCALIMLVGRQAIINDSVLAQCLLLVIATAIGCFSMYAITFALASLFASLTGTILEPLRNPDHQLDTTASSDDGAGL